VQNFKHCSKYTSFRLDLQLKKYFPFSPNVLLSVRNKVFEGGRGL